VPFVVATGEASTVYAKPTTTGVTITSPSGPQTVSWQALGCWTAPDRVAAQPDPDRWWKTRGGVRTEIIELQKLLLDFTLHPISLWSRDAVDENGRPSDQLIRRR
jgi:hypothetical protein